MILAPAAHELLCMLLAPRTGANVNAAVLESLCMLGLADPDLHISSHAEEVLVGCVRVDDIERLPGALTAFGRIAGLALPNDGCTVKLTFVQGPQILTIELPADCWIQVLS